LNGRTPVVLSLSCLISVLPPPAFDGQVAPQPATAAPLAAPVESPTAQIRAFEAVPMPKDADALLELGSKANGLASTDLKPWYLKAHYQAYDAQAKPARAGVIEIAWAAKDRYRISFNSPGFTATEYRAPEGRFRAGVPGRVPYAERLILQQIFNPANYPLKPESIELKDSIVSNVNLACVSFGPKAALPDVYCFTAEHPALRVTNDNGYERLFNQIAIFQHRFLAEKVDITDGGQRVLTLQIDAVRGMTSSEASSLEPGPGASREESWVASLPVDVTPIKTVKVDLKAASKSQPSYPMLAK
jgi:hypothetical protein